MKIIEKAVRHFGIQSQLIKAIEEMSELIKELTKDLANEGDVNHISEEMADVQIMLAQLHYIYSNEYSVRCHMRDKLERLNQRIVREEDE